MWHHVISCCQCDFLFIERKNLWWLKKKTHSNVSNIINVNQAVNRLRGSWFQEQISIKVFPRGERTASAFYLNKFPLNRLLGENHGNKVDLHLPRIVLVSSQFIYVSLINFAEAVSINSKFHLFTAWDFRFVGGFFLSYIYVHVYTFTCYCITH